MRHPDGHEIEVDSYEKVKYDEPADGVARVSMNRPGIRNAQDTQMLAELDDAFKRAENDDDIRCLIFTGEGQDFSAGHDLGGWGQNLTDRGDELNEAFWRDWYKSVEDRMEIEEEWYLNHAMDLRDLDIPTIASVQGHCILGAVMLADICDLIVASDDARFWVPSLRHVGSGAEIQTLPYTLGVRKTKEMLWTGDPLYGEDAKDLGLVNRAVPAEDLEEETLYLARRIALMPEVALRITKKDLNNMLDQMGQRDAINYHFALHQIVHASNQSDEWHDEASRRHEEGDLGDWLDEYGKDQPKID